MSNKLSARRPSIAGSKRSSREFSPEDIFILIFRSFCKEKEIDVLPIIKFAKSLPSYDNFSLLPIAKKKEIRSDTQIHRTNSSKASTTETEKWEMLALMDHPTFFNVINSILIKNFVVRVPMIEALGQLFNTYTTLTTLRLENCSLDCMDVKTLGILLQNHENITDVSLDGNPVPEENYFQVLFNTQLISLSLKRCNIHEIGIKRIAKVLQEQSEHKLVFLNLASNKLRDSGVVHLANILRLNRTLCYINIADNFITDEGCETMLSVLQTFPLTHEEIVARRHRNLANLKKRNELILQLMQNIANKTPEENVHSKSRTDLKKTLRRFSADKIISKKVLAKQILPKKAASTTSTGSKQVLDLSSVEGLSDPHPLIVQCLKVNKQFVCRGNDTLAFINFSYNKLENCETFVSAMFDYQKEHFNGAGIKRLYFEGNKSLILEQMESPSKISLYKLALKKSSLVTSEME